MAQGVALAGLIVGGYFLNKIAQQIVCKAGGVKGFEGEIGL